MSDTRLKLSIKNSPFPHKRKKKRIDISFVDFDAFIAVPIFAQKNIAVKSNHLSFP